MSLNEYIAQDQSCTITQTETTSEHQKSLRNPTRRQDTQLPLAEGNSEHLFYLGVIPLVFIMSLNYSFTGDWDAATKESVGKWVKEKLTVVQDGEPPEDLFLEYIIVMIGNGKKMQELSHELQDFIGEKSANDFAADLGTYLQSITSSETATQPLEEVEEPQAVSLNIVKSNKDILEGGLSSSRSTGPTIQKSSRLLDNALKSTTSSHKRNSSGNQFSHSAPPVGITTQSSQKNAAGGASGPGLFTKRGMANSITADSGRNRDVDDQHKKRKIIMEGKVCFVNAHFYPILLSCLFAKSSYNLSIFNKVSNGQPAAMTNRRVSYEGIDPGMVGSRDMRIGGPAFGPGQNFPQPMPIGFPATMDPSAMYMEQMNMMARMSGFGNVEDMMHFQQNMMANMMGGGGMPMPMMMPAPFGGRQMPPYDQQAQMFHNQFER